YGCGVSAYPYQLRRHHLGVLLTAARRVELEVLPGEREHARGDRAAGHAGDARELLQVAELVEAPQRARVEQHRPEAAARQAQRYAGLGRIRIGIARDASDGMGERVVCRHSLRTLTGRAVEVTPARGPHTATSDARLARG